MIGAARDRLLVAGASGLVGAELARRARDAGWAVEGLARRVRGEATRAVDLEDRAALERTLADVAPAVLAICSAWPHVDGCERDPDRSRRENVGTVANAVAATRGSAVRIVFYSTDHVFDGTRPVHFDDDPVRPLSVYARHKRDTETLLLERGNALVVRTAWVFGVELDRKNFLYRVVDAARRGTPLDVPAGQAGCPTWSGWLADTTLALLRDGMDGVVHVAGSEALTKAEWARLLLETLALPPCPVREVAWDAAGQVAPRPARVVLGTTRHAYVQPPLRTILPGLRAAVAP